MDLALFLHKTEQMFVGDFPKNVDEYFKRFALAMGYSATAFAKNRRSGPVAASKAGPRGLDDLCTVSGMFRGRYCYNEARINLTPNDVDKMLTMQAELDDESDDDDGGEWTTPKIKINVPDQPSPIPLTNATLSSKSQKRKQKTPSTTSGLRPIQLLNALLNAVQSEMLELSFNHFRLHLSSWRLLRSLKQTLEGDLRDMYGPGFLEKENQLPFIVGYIFMTASQTSKLAGVLVLKKKEQEVTSRLLVKAAMVMKAWLESGAGEIETMMLQNGLRMEVEVEDFAEMAGQGNVEGAP